MKTKISGYTLDFLDDSFIDHDVASMAWQYRIYMDSDLSGRDVRKYLDKNVPKDLMKNVRVIKVKYEGIRIRSRSWDSFVAINGKLKELETNGSNNGILR